MSSVRGSTDRAVAHHCRCRCRWTVAVRPVAVRLAGAVRLRIRRLVDATAAGARPGALGGLGHATAFHPQKCRRHRTDRGRARDGSCLLLDDYGPSVARAVALTPSTLDHHRDRPVSLGECTQRRPVERRQTLRCQPDRRRLQQVPQRRPPFAHDRGQRCDGRTCRRRRRTTPPSPPPPAASITA